MSGRPRLWRGAPRTGQALVIRLDPVYSPAAGAAPWGVEEPLRAAGMALRTVALTGATRDGPGTVRAELARYRDEFGRDGDVVVATRSSHRFEWQRPVLEWLRADCPEAVVVDMGVPGDDFSTFRGWIQTFGAARVCALAAAGRLLGDGSTR
jgi:beta-N-acetylhexosaminidase